MKNINELSFFFILAIFVSMCTSTLAEGKCPSETEKRVENKYSNPHKHLLDQAFGMALTPDDFLTPFMSPFSSLSPFGFRDYFRPWRYLSALNKDVGSSIKTDKNQFQINLDVQHFAPEEITVKTADGYIVVEAKHEEKQDDHGFISRQFVRRYALPEGVEPEKVVSQLSSDGVLTVIAPRKQVEVPGERVVPITRTGPVKTESKESQETCDSETCISNQ
ncbi:protein lethal(2)essential for life-like [Hyposmocoma kahamanoa]|uniref:protein lethal(2)essential for life-like n=1 Tax=Hyposmocoma kahamanoa TaxID=1477025 RepID=UPI000E6D7DD0|nr:protein lethal(2)essential for life-like [Hyposmocoma kahamanoa]